MSDTPSAAALAGYSVANTMIEWYFYTLLVLILFVGMSIGSFMNVVIYRLPRMIYGEEDGHFSLAWPGSHCPDCQHKIHWYDNIPLLSWLLLRRRCRYCRQPISGRYPLTECLVGLYFVGLFFLYSQRQPPDALFSATFFYSLLPGLVLFCLLWCLCFIDFQHYLIPDGLSLGVLWSGLFFNSVELIDLPLAQTLIGCMAVWLLLTLLQKFYYALRKKDGLGSGDIKLFAAATPWLGWQKLPELILYSALCGLVFYLALRFFRRSDNAGNKPGDETLAGDHNENNADILPCHFPFGPAIAFALLVLFFLP